ncbi:RHOMBOID-like protein 12, mitochondrial [Linum grandiflorum]
MQRLLSKRFLNGYSSSFLSHSQPHINPFTSLNTPGGNYPIQCFGSSTGQIFHGFRPNPSFSKHLSNSHFRSLVGSRAGFLEAPFARGYHRFHKGFRSSGPHWRSWFDRLTANEVVWGLVITNAAVFLLWRTANPIFMVQNFMISLDNFKSGRIHTLITSAFSHEDFEHLLYNMFGLYFFGINIAQSFGPQYLLKLYLGGAIGGSVFYLLHHYLKALSSKDQGILWGDPSRTPGLGASGAVNAIMLLEIFLNPRATIMLNFIIPVPAMLLGVFLIGKDVWRIVQGDSHISGSVHLGGAAVAAVAWYRIRRGRF